MIDLNEEKDDIFSMEDGFDANWFDKIEDDLAKKVIENGKEISKIEDNGTSWYTIYKYEGSHYVGLCDFHDLWLITDDELDQLI